MFESLTQRLSKVLGGLTGGGRLTEKAVDEALEEVRAALLEADVHFRVVRDLIARVREQAVGQEIVKSVSAGQMLVKVFSDELVGMMSSEGEPFTFAGGRPTVVLMAGLQGSGKTTTTAKLAHWLRTEHRRKPLLVAADIQRPAAVDQLKILGEQIDVPVFHVPGEPPEVLAELALAEAKRTGRDTVLVDTAGRLHIDAELMAELSRVRERVTPDTTFLVCDAMTGQDAVRSAEAFQQTLPLDGVILTKLDGDTRGGAALSVRHVTGAPVAFVGVGEKIEDLQRFHADRLVSRILGMGDVVTLVEKAQEHVDEQEAERQMKKMLEDEFTLEDFLSQLKTLQKMGSMKDLMSHMPGMSGLDPAMIDEQALGRTQAVMLSMTPAERRRPSVLDNSRKRRIARGSGTTITVVNQLLNQFEGMRKMMKQLKNQGLFSRLMSRFTGGGLGMGDMAGMAEAAAGGARPGAGGPRPTAGTVNQIDRRKARKKERQRKKQSRKRR